jgi:DhnA family fructose-bisphosphate aldolase class Ia
VFLPNIKLPGLDDEKRGMYVADSIVRTVNYLRKHQRPRFIKTAYTTSKVWSELTQFDPTLIIGALGGPRENARKTLQLAHNVIQNGGRAVLFGRTIFGEESPVGIAQALRSVLDGELSPEDAHSAYQKSIRRNSGKS